MELRSAFFFTTDHRGEVAARAGGCNSLNSLFLPAAPVSMLNDLRPPISLSVFSLQTLKRKEKEYEHEMERLAREKIATQQRLAELKNELSQCMDVLEIDRVLRQTIQPEDDQASTSTASGRADHVLAFPTA